MQVPCFPQRYLPSVLKYVRPQMWMDMSNVLEEANAAGIMCANDHCACIFGRTRFAVTLNFGLGAFL